MDRLIRHPIIALSPQSIELAELFIISEDNSYLYQAASRCRSAMKKQPREKAKTYFFLETSSDAMPLEMIQYYYNEVAKGCKVEQLQFKNGRVGLPNLEGGGSYISLNTTKALLQFDITERSDDFPTVPLQCEVNEMTALFDFRRLPSFSDENTLHIQCTPKKYRHLHFAGEMWIDR